MNPLKDLAEKLEFTSEDVAFRMAKEDVKLTSAAVRNWFAGTATPSVAYAEPLARVFGISKARMLEIIHGMAVARKEAAAAK